MNSFQIKQAKADLLRIVREQPAHMLAVSDALEALRGGGHRITDEALHVLVEGSAQPVLAFTADRQYITTVETP